MAYGNGKRLLSDVGIIELEGDIAAILGTSEEMLHEGRAGKDYGMKLVDRVGLKARDAKRHVRVHAQNEAHVVEVLANGVVLEIDARLRLEGKTTVREGRGHLWRGQGGQLGWWW